MKKFIFGGMLMSLLTSYNAYAGSKLLVKRWNPFPKVSDRQYYEKLRKTDFGKGIVQECEKLLDQELPAPSEKLYRSSFVTKERRPYELQHTGMIIELNLLTMGILLDPRPEFIARWTKIGEMLNNLKVWILPAHDQIPHVKDPMANIDGKEITTDLRSTSLAASVSVALNCLEEVLDKKLVAALRNKVNTLVIDPIYDCATKKKKLHHWMKVSHNWNAVCFCNSLWAVLSADIPDDKRQEIVKLALRQMPLFMQGFAPDGYCKEGPGYYGFGFGHFLYSAFLLYEASDHKLNILRQFKAEKFCDFPEKMMLTKNLYPLYADCNPTVKPKLDQLAIRDYLLGVRKTIPWNLEAKKVYSGWMEFKDNMLLLRYADLGKNYEIAPLAEFSGYMTTGIFVWRKGKYSLGFKGGSNFEFHNHNDVGHYVFAKGDTPMLIDAGNTIYKMNTFHGGKRYDNKLRSSYGHALPVINGECQIPGEGTDAVVLAADKDHAVLDIKAAYNVPDLKKLVREVKFSDAGVLTVTDSAELEKEGTFAVAVITLGEWKQIAPGKLEISDADWVLDMEINASGKYEITDELLDEDNLWGRKIRRILITFTEKDKKFNLSTKFTERNK